jgi:AAHS family 4-hydroxybenzoate transporter-like MFS transporter
VYSGFNWIPSMLTGAGLPSQVANTGITVYNLGGVVGALTCGILIRRFGSRLTMIGMALGACLAALVMRTMVITATANPMPILMMLALTGAMINAVQVTLYALAAHVYPTGMRATGVGTATSVGRVGAILSTYAGAWALDMGGHGYFFGLVAIAMLAVVLSLWLVRRHIPFIPARASGALIADRVA